MKKIDPMTATQKMPEVQRYNFEPFNEYTNSAGYLEEDLNGEWVEYTTLLVEREAAQREIERLCGLLYGAKCVYCGEVVGKETLNQDIADRLLREHVLTCPKHPVAVLATRLEEAEKLLKALGEWIERNEPLCLPDAGCERCNEMRPLVEQFQKYGGNNG